MESTFLRKGSTATPPKPTKYENSKVSESKWSM